MSFLHPLDPRPLLAAASLCALALPACAQDPAEVGTLVYAGGEAMSPQTEARLRALQLPAERTLSRAEVVEQWLEARAAGTLAGHGDAADRPSVLQARFAANQRQTQQLLAAREAAEREAARLAAAEAERVAQAAAAAAATATPGSTETSAAPGLVATAPAATGETAPPVTPAADAAPANDSPEPTPSDRPGAPVAPMAPLAPSAPTAPSSPARPALDDDET